MKSQLFLRDKAYQEIRLSIITGVYEINTILYESVISKQLGMSRTPIREALLKLADEGLVNNLPNSGFLVISFTEREIREIFDLRLCLEKYVIEELFDKNINYDISVLERLSITQSEAYENSDYLGFFSANQAFHLELVKMLENITMVKVIENLGDKPIRTGYMALRKNVAIVESVSEHIKIVEALKKGDKEEAINAIINHTENGKKRYFNL